LAPGPLPNGARLVVEILEKDYLPSSNIIIYLELAFTCIFFAKDVPEFI
jgi:hypothetical protein